MRAIALTLALLAVAAPVAAATVPCRIADGTIVVGARVNGVPGRFILDTGASDMALTHEAAERLGVVPTSHRDGFAVGRVDVAFAGYRARGLEAVVLTPRQGRALALLGHGTPVDGLLGYAFLRRFRTTVDYAAHRVTLAPSRAGGRGVARRVDDDQDVPRVDVEVNGGPPTPFLVDTGATAVLVPEDLVDPAGGAAAVARYQGVKGTGLARSVVLSELSVGNARVVHLEAGVARQVDNQTLLWGQALLGYPYLSRFRVTLDGPRRTLYLERPPAGRD